MDFLALPKGLRDEAIVPDLGGPDYDNCGFNDYPKRQGWQIGKLLKGDIVGARDDWDEYSQMVLRDVPPDQMPETGEDLIQAVTGPFVQTWLFFGLFHEVLSRPVRRTECSFLSKNNTSSMKRYLSARHLFAEFLQRKEQIEDDVPWCTRILSCLREAAWALENLDRVSVMLGGSIIPSFAHLALCVLVNALDDHSVILCQPHIRAANASVGRCRCFEQRLLDDGWCPNMVKRLRTDLGIEGLYYASLINSSDMDRSHDACTDSLCVAYNHVEDETYLFQHSVKYCPCKDKHCSHLADNCVCSTPSNMDTAACEAAAIVAKGGTPLLSLLNGNSGPEIRVTPFCHGIKYVAISHVWSDGMGNPHRNSLPLCQIQALDYFVSRARASPIDSDPAYLWIDTICVPRAPNALRLAAIRAMRDTYRNAECVLVICRELSTIPLPITPDEVLVRIFRSKWMTRLWTLQEGALAAKLAFQFADHAIDYDHLDDLVIAALSDTTTSHLVGNRANLSLSSITSVISVDSSEKAKGEESQKMYSSLWSALRHRSTSNRSDEAICVAVLLGVELGPILESPNERKMEAFWKNQDQVPTGVLWVNGPRMDINSLHWAPESLLDARTWGLSFSNRGSWARRSSDGLSFRGIEGFSLVKAPLPETSDGVLGFHDARSGVDYYVSRMDNVGNAQWTELAKCWSNCALLWREAPSPEIFTAGALLSCNKENKDGTRYARWLAQVSVSVKGGEWDQIILGGQPEFADGKVTNRAIPVTSIPSVEYIKPDAEWCIW